MRQNPTAFCFMSIYGVVAMVLPENPRLSYALWAGLTVADFVILFATPVGIAFWTRLFAKTVRKTVDIFRFWQEDHFLSILRRVARGDTDVQ